MARRTWTDKQLIEAVANSRSRRQVLFKLGLATEGGSYETINRNVKRLNLDISHWTGKGWNKGNHTPKRAIEEYLVLDGPEIKSPDLKKRLVREKILLLRCQFCQITEWRNKPIRLELDHINGNHKDNRLENLRLLCPNCHSQTDTFYRGHLRSAKRDFVQPNYEQLQHNDILGSTKEKKNKRRIKARTKKKNSVSAERKSP